MRKRFVVAVVGLFVSGCGDGSSESRPDGDAGNTGNTTGDGSVGADSGGDPTGGGDSARADSANGDAVKLPIEILGVDGTVESVTVSLDSTLVTGPLKLWMQVHSLSYADKASVQINSGSWVSLNNTTVSVSEPGKSYGGIGGAFATLKMALEVPPGTLVSGKNTLRFRFNRTDGRSLGFRVLKFNFLDATGNRILPDAAFRDDDPTTWTPPHPESDAIARGQSIWNSSAIKDPVAAGGSPLRAHCSDCHARDGRDLKYFNYSNRSIIERSKFHGLTATEGELIASYVRTRDTISPGRPWNPPYQPGAGLDAKPVETWSAGAGVDAVLDDDATALKAMFPNGITVAHAADRKGLNVREIPVVYQFPDWNHWLPSVHPLDAWGTDIDRDPFYLQYQSGSVPKAFADAKAANYQSLEPGLRYALEGWQAARYNFLSPRYDSGPRAPSSYTPQYGQKLYASALWQLVKLWELMHEYGIEGHELWGDSREPRNWFDSVAFDVSPNLLHIPDDKTGINNNSPLMKKYFSAAWYQVQLTLNSGNYGVPGHTSNIRPVDWGYAYGFITDTWLDSRSSSALLFVEYLLKGMHVSDLDNGVIDDTIGFRPTQAGNVSLLVNPSKAILWTNSKVAASDRTQLFEVIVQYWLTKAKSFTASEYYRAGFGPNTYVVPSNPQWDVSTLLADKIWLMIPKFRDAGVSNATLNPVADWAATVWPQNNWASLKR